MKAMKTLAIVACLAAAACGEDAPTGPTTTDAVFNVALSAANEVPPISNAEAAATGTATITFHITRDTAAGAITGATVDFSVTLANFPAGSVARLAHIHTGPAGVAGPVLIDTGLSPAAAVALADGTGSFSYTGVAISPENATAVLVNPAGYYFNVHSVLNGSGAVRGQLR
ncbi:MAG: CHRD domain-containing protein [Acidobacteria bacterium]|nr:MAG: CHRD domain-containing protein [Acidobacteriota bacterium]